MINLKDMSIKDIVAIANFEYNTSGRSPLFIQIEKFLIKQGNIAKIAEFIQNVEGAHIKALEKCITTSAVSLPNIYFELAYYVKGVNIKALEDRLIKCKDEIDCIQYLTHISQFATYIKSSNVNKLLLEIINYPIQDEVSKLNICANIVRRRKDANVDMLQRYLDSVKNKHNIKDDNKLQREIDNINNEVEIYTFK